jgi:hypothetical protein
MPSWSALEAEASELVALARSFLDAHAHKTIATLRRDGSPRIRGTKILFADGELWLGSMRHSVKALDLRRDPRFALHSGPLAQRSTLSAAARRSAALALLPAFVDNRCPAFFIRGPRASLQSPHPHSSPGGPEVQAA